MSLIEDFFLDKERIRKVLLSKIEGELHVDFAARQALESPTPIQSEAEKSVKTWMDRYRVLRGKKLSAAVRERLVRAIIKDAPQIRRSLTATSILDNHCACPREVIETAPDRFRFSEDAADQSLT